MTSSNSRLILCLLLTLLLGGESWAQKSNSHLIPAVNPPTPEVASLGKFGSYPVNYFTGLVNIDIPLHEIVVGDLTVPIAISYHSSGNRVADRSTWVGLGWSLQAGGNISRKFMSLPDELPGGYLTEQTVPLPSQINTNTTAGLNILHNVNRGVKDAEPDIYMYSFPPGKSGRFVFNQQNNYKPVMIPYTPIRIDKALSSGNLQFEITDEYGTNYKFNEIAELSDVTMGYTQQQAKTAWMLSKIISKDKQDSIKFNYTSRYGQVNADITDYLVINDLSNTGTLEPSCLNNVPSDLGTYTTKTEAIFSTEQKISEVIYPLGKVVFESLTVRQDGYAGMFGGPAQKELDKIYVYNLNTASNTYLIQKTIEFHQSYFISNDGITKRLKLDSLSIFDAQSKLIQRYRFEYNTSGVTLPAYLSRERDYFGYFNNVQNNTLVPRMQISYQNCLGGCSPVNMWIGSNFINGRDPDPVYMQANILKKIVHPAGGSTEFIYETNQYKDQNNVPRYAGGLRIKQIKIFDGKSSTPLLKTYTYGASESGYGRPNFMLNNYVFENNVTERVPCGCVSGTRRQRTYGSTASIEMEPYDGSPVTYSTVAEYQGDETNNIGKTVYTFTDYQDNLNTTILLGTPILNSYHYKRGLLSSQSVYKKIDATTYQIVQKTQNTYQAFADSLKSSIGFKVRKNYVTIVSGVDTPLPPDSETTCQDDTDSYFYNYYAINTGDAKLISTTETAYDQATPSKTFVTTTNYYYNNYNHQQVTSTGTSNSVGESIVNSIKYPHESAGSVYTEMIQKNLLAYPVEETTTRNGNQLEKITRNYFKFSTNVFEPQTIYRQLKNGPDELEVTFTGYDLKGNILGYVSKENVPQTFLWAYKNSYPIAAVAGASQGEVFYTSFEENPTNISTLESKTGERAWWNTTYNTPALSAGTYKLTYWKKAGTAQWEYMEDTITGSTPIGGLGIYIDEVRIYPAKARMTTYTFKPGIGMTAMTDTNNQITSYEYDGFSRLSTIRDFNKDILKRYVYNYKKK